MPAEEAMKIPRRYPVLQRLVKKNFVSKKFRAKTNQPISMQDLAYGRTPWDLPEPQSNYPQPIGFQNFETANPAGQPQRAGYPPATTYNREQPIPTNASNINNDTPAVGFEGFTPKWEGGDPKHSAKSASEVELENVEDITEEFGREEQHQHVRSVREELIANLPKPLYFRDGRKKIDYILAFEEHPDKPTEWQEKRTDKRESFEEKLREQGLELEQEDFEASKDGKTVYIKIHAPWEVLANGAEEMMMKMPTMENDTETKGMIDKLFGCFNKRNPFEIYDDALPIQPNYFTCAFKRTQLEKFKGHENKDTFFTSSQRSQIVYRILKSTTYDPNEKRMGVDRLVSNLSYSAAFPLHEGYHKYNAVRDSEQTERQILYNVWGKFRRFYKKQPLNLIRKYFGEKIGIYFAWLGFYTIFLFPAAIIGVISVIYGLAQLSDYAPVNIICNKTLEKKYAMCPTCDKKCDYFPLYDVCEYAKVAYVFDNEFTVVFAVFMSLWSTMFLEFWKRRQIEIAYQWDLLGYEDEEENIRPEFDAICNDQRLNPITLVQEPYYPSSLKCPRFLCSATSVLLMICLVLASVFGVIIYRVAVFASLSAAYDNNISSISLTVTATAAVINLVIILLLSQVYEKLAYILTDMELPRTQSNYEDSFTIKMYLFQFVNYYSSLFYIGFAKLNPGRPGDYHRIFGYRQEECNAAGCLVELTVQLAIIMVGKQIFNASMEIVLPKLRNWWKRRGNILKKFRGEELDVDSGPMSLLQWESDNYLTPVPRNALFYEYLEMVIQFGFITIFVAAFPLGPLFALLNNLVEIRLDAYKFITTFRRPRAARAEDIGIWYSILKAVAICSVVVNSFVIAFVSEFVPRLYFKWGKGKSGSLEGYLDTSLSCFDIRDYSDTERPRENFTNNFESNGCGLNLDSCRYRGYRDKPMSIVQNPSRNLTNNYDFSKDYWHILSGQLFFVIAFLIVVFGLTAFLAYLIPDRPKKLDNQIKREAFLARSILRADQGNIEA